MSNIQEFKGSCYKASEGTLSFYITEPTDLDWQSLLRVALVAGLVTIQDKDCRYVGNLSIARWEQAPGEFSSSLRVSLFKVSGFQSLTQEAGEPLFDRGFRNMTPAAAYELGRQEERALWDADKNKERLDFLENHGVCDLFCKEQCSQFDILTRSVIDDVMAEQLK